MNEVLQAAAVGSIFSPIPVDTWLGPQLQGFESVGLVLCEEKSAPPTDDGNPPRHMLKTFNTIMANSHLRMASV